MIMAYVPKYFIAGVFRDSHKLLLVDWNFLPRLLSVFGNHKHLQELVGGASYCILGTEEPTRLTLAVLHGQRWPEMFFRM